MQSNLLSASRLTPMAGECSMNMVNTKPLKSEAYGGLNLADVKPQRRKISRRDIGGGFILVGNPYVYGKKITILPEGRVGQQYLIGGKGNKNGGVAVSSNIRWSLGLGYPETLLSKRARPQHQYR